ncbi:hypothetical protein AYO20_06307 [Fonsecaea nubica]|uniref:Uncharacterized protein n=1 Tax=Fonsecaea nubica TaxID=856822 RepID=A0A178CZ53_9EURO|nr:hypothetical protein AYO20_06307 [Fonsecaea nubica]OAL34464.1 hypothetical protein AYO20_06307 [Fonsecaea nubica]
MALQQTVAGAPSLYTNWTQLPTCAQTCYSTALLQAFGSCGSILSRDGNGDPSSSYASASASVTTTATMNDNNVGIIDDDSPSAMLRRCICTDCSYRTALAACLSGSCTTADASVDDILGLNDRVFCNASVDATVQMWDRNLIWVVGAQGDESSSSSGTPREMVWTCATGTSSVTETATAATSSSLSSSGSSSTSQTTVPAIRTTTITATLTPDPSYPSQATNPSSVTLTVPLETGSDIVSALTSISTTLSSSAPTTTPTSLSSMPTHSSSTSESSTVTVASVTASSWATPPFRSFGAGILLVSAVLVGLVY